MSYIIGIGCVDVKDRSCIDACPVDCIYENIQQMLINPDECIDCGACLPACPVEAIFHSEAMAIRMGDEASVHTNYRHFGLEYKD
mgnify:FL=1